MKYFGKAWKIFKDMRGGQRVFVIAACALLVSLLVRLFGVGAPPAAAPRKAIPRASYQLPAGRPADRPATKPEPLSVQTLCKAYGVPEDVAMLGEYKVLIYRTAQISVFCKPHPKYNWIVWQMVDNCDERILAPDEAIERLKRRKR